MSVPVVRTNLTRRGYRRVLTRLAYERLRYVVPVLALAGVLSSAGGSGHAALFSFSALLALPVAVWGLTSWQAHRPGLRALFEPTEMRFQSDGLVCVTSDAPTIVEWTDFRRWREAADHLILYVAGSQYLLVPLGGISHEQRADVIGVVTERVGPPRTRSRIAGILRRRS